MKIIWLSRQVEWHLYASILNQVPKERVYIANVGFCYTNQVAENNRASQNKSLILFKT